MFTLNEFVSHDNVPENDRAFYRQLTTAFEADLQPFGALEVVLAADMLRCTFLMRHYSSVDPATLTDDAARQILNIRHNAALKSFRWSTNQLRKTQTDREIGSRVGCHPRGLAGVSEILKATNGTSRTQAAPPNHASTNPAPSSKPAPKPAAMSLADVEALLHRQIEEEGEAELQAMAATHADLKKQTQFVPRNAPCPCGSGEKHKRCCGKDAPAVPGDWLRNVKTAA